MNFKGLNEWLENCLDGGVSGCCAAVNYNGTPVYRGYFGKSDIENNIPVSDKTVFRLASMTKPVTATSALICMEKGLLCLDDEISKFLPGYKNLYLAEKNGEGFVRGELSTVPVTVKHLLTHGSGICSGAAGDWQYGRFQPKSGDTVESVVKRAQSVMLDFIPGTNQAYSPIMAFDIMVEIIQKVSDMPYDDFLKKYISDPLEIESFTYKVPQNAQNTAVVYVYEGGKLIGRNFPGGFEQWMPDGYTGGGAGLMSNLNDYVKFADGLLKSFDGKGILSKNSAEAMRRQYHGTEIAGMCDLFNWGLGVRCVWAKSDWQTLSPGSFGWSGAYGTHFWVDPEKKLAAVYMHNSATPVYGGSGAAHTLVFEKKVNEIF